MSEINWTSVKRISLLFLGATVLVCIVLFSGNRQHRMTCKAIRIELPDSENFVTAKDIRLILAKQGIHEGMKADSIHIQDIEQRISLNPFVLKADVSVDLGGILMVKVSQKHPMLLVLNQQGQRYYVDVKGLKMPYFKYDTARFFSVKGVIKERYHHVDTLESTDLKQVFQYAKFLQAYPQRKRVCRAFYVNAAHEIEIAGPQKEFYFLMGDTSDMDGKFKRMDLMYSVVFPKEGFTAYSMINLKFADQLVCVRKDEKNTLLNANN